MTDPLTEAKARLANLVARDDLDRMMNDYGLKVVDARTDVWARKAEINRLEYLIRGWNAGRTEP